MTTPLAQRFAAVLMLHSIQPNTQLLRDLELATRNTKDDTEAEVSALVFLFCELKHQAVPIPKTPRERSDFRGRFEVPLRELVRTCNGRSAEVLRAAVEKMRADGLTCAYPKQALTVALSEYDALLSNQVERATAWEAWTSISSYVAKQKRDGMAVGWIELPELSDERTRRAVEAVGWRECCQPDSTTRAHFVKAWESAG